MPAQSRIIVVVNKSWECDPVCWVLTNEYIKETCGLALPWPDLVAYPTYGPVPPQVPSRPRLAWTTQERSIEIWCISDLLSRFPARPSFQSSSECKMKVLPEIFASSPLAVELVVAVGTASSGPDCPAGIQQDNINGSVVVGSKVFLHDGHPDSEPNPDSRWRWGNFDKRMDSSLSTATLRSLSLGDGLESALLCPPTNPAPDGQRFYLHPDFCAIGDINVTNYAEYGAKDAAAGKAFKDASLSLGVSLETTHGLIYAAARDHFMEQDPPFLFVSGVVDRFTQFSLDVKKIYAQNTTGAHNAGVAVAGLLHGFLNASS